MSLIEHAISVNPKTAKRHDPSLANKPAPKIAILTCMDPRMNELLEWLDRPAAFFGHCLGGLTMFASLRALPPQRAHLVKHAFACGVRPPHLLRRRRAFEDNLAYGMMLRHGYDASISFTAPGKVFLVL